MERLQQYKEAFISLSLGAVSFAVLAGLAASSPFNSERLDAALFGACIFAANLTMAWGARIAYQRMPHTRMRWRALQALLITLAFVGLLRVDLILVIRAVQDYTDSGIISISELVTMVTWVASFTLVWVTFLAESENSIIAKSLTLLLALMSASMLFVEPVAYFLGIQAEHEISISKYALTCLALAVAISSFLSEWRSWKKQVNINSATTAELKAKLPFLTHRQSRGIVAARRAQPFESLEQLKQVADIDDETFRAISPHARI